jgi:hypothetical protein
MDSKLSVADEGLWTAVTGDGRPLLGTFALGLGLAGAFAWFVSAVGETLPHELRFLGMTAPELHALADGRVADFMTHDRVAFGGTLIALAVLYLWIVAVPLAAGERWAWVLVAISGVLGFASFLAYLGYGYFDLWHAVATAVLLPIFVVGMAMTRRIDPPLEPGAPDRRAWGEWRTVEGLGRALILLTGVGMIVAGTTILTLGTIVVFVPQDLIYIGFDRAALDALNTRLVPLIAHDRSGFGGGLLTVGVLVIGCVGAGRPSRSLWQALLVAGGIGFGAAIGIHGIVGYLDMSHVGPAAAGGLVFVLGMIFSRPRGHTADGLRGTGGSDFALTSIQATPAAGGTLASEVRASAQAADEPANRARRIVG